MSLFRLLASLRQRVPRLVALEFEKCHNIKLMPIVRDSLGQGLSLGFFRLKLIRVGIAAKGRDYPRKSRIIRKSQIIRTPERINDYSNLSFGSCFNILFAFLIEPPNSVFNLRLLFLYFLYDPFLMPPIRLNPLKVGLESPSELSSASYKSSVVVVSNIRLFASDLFTGTF